MLIGIDTETHRIGPGNVAPPMVCLSYYSEDEKMIGLASRGDPDNAMRKSLCDMLHYAKPKAFSFVGHNLAYDLAVIVREDPTLLPLIFSLLEQGKFHDTKIREMLINLAVQGNMLFFTDEFGVNNKLGYKLSDLVMKHFAKDISSDKNDSDAWRLNYAVLETTPTAEWPVEAQNYAIDDSKHAVMVYQAQEESRKTIQESLGIDVFKTERFRVFADFCLKLMTCRGVQLNAAEIERVEAELAAKLTPDKLDLLLSSGILRPAEPPRPHARGAKDKDGNPKMTKGVPESVDMAKLKAHVVALAEKLPGQVTLKYTAASERFPDGQVSTDADFLEQHWHLCPILEQYKYRADLQKMVTTELPRMKWEGKPAPVVHPCFEPLKATGRVSSKADDLFPSFNGQNVDPAVRPCYEAREGHVFFSADYSQMELGTAAQKCLDLFGKSVLAEKINAGVDTHEYLGAQLAYTLDANFQSLCVQAKLDGPDAIYDAFHSLKANEATKAFHKHYRTFAKPTGLGYPGGLGAETFIVYARATYGVTVDLETAKTLKKVWLQTYPEFVEYFKWINRDCIDRVNSNVQTNDIKYAYTSPMGMYRAGCDYCAAANGAALQTPSAEGAIMGLCNVVRACYDVSQNNVLYGRTHPLIFIHDEIFGETVEDDGVQDRMKEVERIMVAAMKKVTPDVVAKTQTCLMRRWYKEAEPVYDSTGRLSVWSPKTLPSAHP